MENINRRMYTINRLKRVFFIVSLSSIMLFMISIIFVAQGLDIDSYILMIIRLYLDLPVTFQLLLPLSAISFGIYISLRRRLSLSNNNEIINIFSDTNTSNISSDETNSDETNSDETNSDESLNYITYDLSEDDKDHFINLLHGFEKYARLKGYDLRFNIKNERLNQVQFNFTILNPDSDVTDDVVLNDISEYMSEITKSKPFSEMTPTIPKADHDKIVSDLQQQIAILKESHIAEISVFEKCIDKLQYNHANQKVIVQVAGDNMDNRKYDLRNANTQNTNIGDGNSIDNSIKLGTTLGDQISQLENIDKLLKALRNNKDDVLSEEDAFDAYADLKNAKDHIKDSKTHDSSKLKKWLERAKYLINVAKQGSEIYILAQEVCNSFGIV